MAEKFCPMVSSHANMTIIIIADAAPPRGNGG